MFQRICVAIAPFIIIYQITPLNYVRHKAHILKYFDIKYLTHKIVLYIMSESYYRNRILLTQMANNTTK